MSRTYQVFTPNEVYRELLRARAGEPFIVDTERGSIYVGPNIGLGWDYTLISSLGPVPQKIAAKVQPASEGLACGGGESETGSKDLRQTATPRVPVVPRPARFPRTRPMLPVYPGRPVIGRGMTFDFGPAKPPAAAPVSQAPLQPLGQVALKKEAKEPKEPTPPKDPKDLKEGGNPPLVRQAAEGKTAAETEEPAASSTLHSTPAINGEDRGGKRAALEADLPLKAADDCPALGLEMASSGELGPLTPLTGDDESDGLSELCWSITSGEAAT